MRRDHDDDHLRVDLQDATQPLEPLPAGRLAGPEIHVEQHGIEIVLLEEVRNLFGTPAGHDLGKIAPQQQTSRGQDVLVVVNDQDVARVSHVQRPPELSGIVH